MKPRAKKGINIQDGLTDVGFNYNSAWGGPFKNGGWLDNLPQAQMGDVIPLDKSQALKTLSTLGEVFSAPQKSVTKVITGKYQAPSEALGITNPYGQFATDMVLDPLNIGIVPLSKGAYKAGKALMPIVDDFVYETFKAPKTIEKLSAKNIQRELGQRIGQGGNFNTGVYELKRFPNSVVKFENPEDLQEALELDNYPSFDFVDAMKNVPDNTGIAKIRNQFKVNDYKNALVMDKLEGTTLRNISPIQIRKIPEQAYKQLYDNIKTLRNNNLGVDFVGDNIVYNPNKKQFGIFDIDPGEAGPYWMDSIHQGMNKHIYGEDMSAENIKKALQNKFLDEYWMSVDKNIIDPAIDERYLDDKKVEKLLVGGKDFLRDRIQKIYGPLDSKESGGNIPGSVGFTYARTQSSAPSNGKYAKKTMPSAQNGQEMKFYQEGLDWKPKNISKNGKVIEDNLGQWKHPGEITKINSNQITMKGVDYPVLGISNTGDTQMMFPNQEYSYEGKSVTEYPIMQEGGTIAMNKVNIDPRQWMDALSMVQKRDGSVGMWGNPIDSTKIVPIQNLNPIGKTDHRGVRSGQKYQGSPSTVKAIELKEQQLKAQSSRNHYKNGGWLDQYN